MSLLSENIIPGKYGKIFGTNAEKESDLLNIKNSLLKINGIKDVIIDNEKFPKEFNIHASKLVEVKQIEYTVKQLGFHIIPKGIFQI